MKHLKISIFSLFVFASVHAQKTKLIMDSSQYTGESILTVETGKLKNKIGKYYLEVGYNKDSSIISDEKLHFKRHLDEPSIASLIFIPENEMSEISPKPKNEFTFYLTPGETKILTNDSIAGSKIINENSLQKDYSEIRAKQEIFEYKELDPLREAYKIAFQQKNKTEIDAISEKYDSLQTSFKENTIKPYIISKAKTSPVALTLLKNYIGYSLDYVKVNPLYELLSPTFKILPTGKLIGENLVLAKKTQIGLPAMDFTQNDTLGNPVKLSDFKGKYVLVDFWASWCGPCRAENPNVVEAFNTFKDKNFTIISVSFDGGNTRTTKEAWLKAIHTDRLTWKHVSDLQGWNNSVGKLYGIRSIPQNILLDPNGNIIAKNIRGQKLLKTLGNILK